VTSSFDDAGMSSVSPSSGDHILPSLFDIFAPEFLAATEAACQ